MSADILRVATAASGTHMRVLDGHRCCSLQGPVLVCVRAGPVFEIWISGISYCRPWRRECDPRCFRDRGVGVTSALASAHASCSRGEWIWNVRRATHGLSHVSVGYWSNGVFVLWCALAEACCARSVSLGKMSRFPDG